MTRKKRIATAVLLSFVFVLMTFTFRWWRDTFIPIAEPSARLPDAAKVGDVDGAMKQTERLVQALRANEWSPHGIPMRLKRLPDAQLTENANLHDEFTSSYAFPSLNTNPDNPTKDVIATLTDIYVRTNPKRFKGERSTFAPTGFYIVGWKDGRVTQVPIEDVRFVKTGKYNVAVFPGMKAWKKDGIRYNFIEYANGYEKARPEAKAFYKPNPVGEDCVTCKRPNAS